MQWFQIKEKSAGKKRLILTYHIYKIFGKRIVYLIAFSVAFFTFIFSRDLRFYTRKYFKIISKYTNVEPSLMNQFKQVSSYSCSLVDKMIMYSGGYKTEDIIFENEIEKEKLFNDISKQKGVCFLFTHVGNIEVLQAFFQHQKQFPNLGINVFLNISQTKIFNDFLETIKKPIPVKYIITEDFDISSVIKLKENLDRGEVLFIAGDRLSEFNSSKTIEEEMFNHKVKLPEGTFRLVKLLETPIYFISAIKQGDKYKIYLKKQETEDISKDYIKYMEGIIINNPFQFYHFYDFFND